MRSVGQDVRVFVVQDATVNALRQAGRGRMTAQWHQSVRRLKPRATVAKPAFAGSTGRCRIIFSKTIIDFPAQSGNHEGHKGTHRKGASWFFTFVRFVSLVVKPACSRLIIVRMTANEYQFSVLSSWFL